VIPPAGSSSAAIVDIETIVTPFSTGTWLDERRVATPLGPFERFSGSRGSWRGPGADLVHVLVRTDDADVYGIGQTRGGRVVERLILDHLRPLLRGQDSRAILVRYQEMARVTAPYAAGGIGSMAVSAVELALWDLRARALGVPLYAVLGGTPQPIPYYVTCPADAVARPPGAARVVKIAMSYGACDGRAGLRANLDTLAAARAAVGPDIALAIDCFMSWDVPYTVAFARAARDLDLLWIEEPLPVDALDELVTLRKLISPVRVAAGEHLFEPSTVYAYLQRRAIDVLQIDVTWCGGIHAAQALAFAAIAGGVCFAPHTGGVQPWAVHLLSTLGPLGLAEVLADIPPVGGALPPAPTDAPGVGIDPCVLGFTL
jgi:L-rhamnonate dehydratase